MSEFKELMDEYGRKSDIDDMERLTDVIDKFTHKVKEVAPELEKKFITEVKLSNKCIPWDKEQAEYAVKNMRNKDGTTGEHWSYAQTSDVMSKKGYDFNPAEWFYVLNMVYSDHYSQDFPVDTYVKLACDILTDVDAPKNATKKPILQNTIDKGFCLRLCFVRRWELYDMEDFTLWVASIVAGVWNMLNEIYISIQRSLCLFILGVTFCYVPAILMKHYGYDPEVSTCCGYLCGVLSTKVYDVLSRCLSVIPEIFAKKLGGKDDKNGNDN